MRGVLLWPLVLVLDSAVHLTTTSFIVFCILYGVCLGALIAVPPSIPQRCAQINGFSVLLSGDLGGPWNLIAEHTPVEWHGSSSF